MNESFKTMDIAKINKPIALVGLMGAGKTSLGKILARHLGWDFIDSDSEIEKSAGCSISDIFSLYGEEEFRRGEARVISRLFEQKKQMVLSTGEGAFITPEVRDLIKTSSISIWLKADLGVLIKRTSHTNRRPLLKDDNPAQVLENLIVKRYPLYAQADITITSADEDIKTTLNKTLEAIKEYIG
mgnify:CR=1 FL=1|jgi:shikimate kinase